MPTFTTLVGFKVEMENGAVLKVMEGDTLRNLVFMDNKIIRTIPECSVRVVVAVTKANSAGPTDCPPEPYLHKWIAPSMIIADSSDENHAILDRIPVAAIISIGEVVSGDLVSPSAIQVGPGPGFKPLSEVIANAPDGAVIQLAPGEYSDPITLNKSVALVGDLSGGSVLTGPITATANEDGEIGLSLANLKLTGDATITTGPGVSYFCMDNCVFAGHNVTKKTMPINITADTPILMKVSGNTFGDQPKDAYNLFEVRGYLKDGSTFTDNDFSAKSCGHNMISLYGIQDGATVQITYNRAEYSANVVRLGFRGEPVGTVIMTGNSYETTDADPEYGGLFLIQPYSTSTTSMAGLKVIASDNTKPTADEQIGYLWAGEKDMEFTAETVPTVEVDGKKVTFPSKCPAATPIPCV